MRIVFLGSGSFACPTVRAVIHSPRHELAGIVSQPDRPRGRSLHVGACPVKEIAEGAGVPVLTPEKIGAPESVAAIAALTPDILLVADYGQYIPSKVVATAKHHAINVHPSLLPKYRGAAPVKWAVANGERITGVTIQRVSKKMDAGDIVLQQEFEIGENEDAAALEGRLAAAGAELAMKALDLIETGHVHPSRQDESLATYAPKLSKEDGRVDWSMPAASIADRVRGFQPWPGCWVSTARGTLKLIRAKAGGPAIGKPAGTVIAMDGDDLLVATADGVLRLSEVQPESRKPMKGADYARGARFKPGDVIS